MSRYITMITSLPYLAPPEANKVLPISRIGLEQRLAALTEEDWRQLNVMESLFSSSSGWLRTNVQWVSEWQANCQKIESPLIRVFFQQMGEALALLAAVRDRLAGQKELTFEYGDHKQQVKRRANDVLFGLEARYPELAAIAKALTERQAHKAQLILDQWLWSQLIICEQSEMFRFENIASYYLRWIILERVNASRSSTKVVNKSGASVRQAIENEPLFGQMREHVLVRAKQSLPAFMQEAL